MTGSQVIDVDAPAAREVPRREPVLDVAQLVVQLYLGKSIVHAVNGVSFALQAGKTLGIIGESGSGKSITAKAIMGLLPEVRQHVSGSIRLEGSELLGLSDKEMGKFRGKGVALIPQDPARALNPTIRVGEQVVEAVRAHRSVSKEEARASAIDLLERVRLPSAAERFAEYPHQLSGGMRQRVVIAMALAGDPKVLIADEATTALDVTTQAQIMRLLRELQSDQQMGIVLISHDMGIAAAYTDDVAVMYGGRIVEISPTGELFSSVRMPYTKALLDAVPSAKSRPHAALQTVAGAPPDPSKLPSGCAFEPRCPFSDQACIEEVPPLVSEGGHSFACIHPLPAQEQRVS